MRVKQENNSVVIECPDCDSYVNAKVLGEYELHRTEDNPIKWSLLKCPKCNSPILVYQEYVQIGMNTYEWNSAIRLWPEPKKYISWDLPNLVRVSLEEAYKCFKAKAYIACAVMCGRVLESICAEYKTRNKALAGGLKELLDKEIIDKKIFEWGEELRKFRNIGAHAKKEKITKEDAKDLFDFSYAICDYIFILSKRFKDFITRRKNSKKN